MKYFNNEHKKAYHLAIEKSGINDVYHQSLFYTLTIDKDCREHINDLYDFNRNSIKLSGLGKSWHTSGSINTTLMGYNFKVKKIKDPKTEAGVRVVNIPKILVDYLKTQQDDCLYVLHTVKGHRMTEQAWKTLWSSYMADLNAKYGYRGEESKKRPGGLPMRIEPFTVCSTYKQSSC